MWGKGADKMNTAIRLPRILSIVVLLVLIAQAPGAVSGAQEADKVYVTSTPWTKNSARLPHWP
jgi:hypothetical protein